MAIKSSLATSDLQAAKGNYTEGRNGQTVKKITIHHAVMQKVTGKRIAKVFTRPGRRASANYCIGYTRGDICCSLYEENRAWTSSSRDNDLQAITIEVANSSIKEPYPVSDDTLANIIDLCVDICKRYNFKLNWTGDKNGNLTVHRMFSATACPGDYLMSKMQYIADEVNKRLEGTEPEPIIEYTTGKYEILKNKYYRTSTEINNKNLVKYSKLSNATKKQCTQDRKGNAMFKKGAVITVTNIIRKNGRVWGEYANAKRYLVLANIDGTAQAKRVN